MKEDVARLRQKLRADIVRQDQPKDPRLFDSAVKKQLKAYDDPKIIQQDANRDYVRGMLRGGLTAPPQRQLTD